MSYLHVNCSDEDGTLIADTLTGGATTTWGQSARYIYLPTASGPMPVAAIYGTKHYAIQSDHLNTPRRLVQSNGQVAWQWAYSAFGEEKPTIAKNRFANTDLNQSFGSTTVPAVTFNLRYPGQYFDQESNLHYNYHRSYSATTGRYTQADPIGLDGGWNRFGYVGGNPLRFTDPLGLARKGGDTGEWWEFRDRNFQRWFHQCVKSDGDPDASREELAEAYAQWLANGKPDGKNGCGGPPPCEDCKKTAVWVAGATGVGYLVYRCVRMLPSLLPPLWPTIVPNLVAP